MIRLIAARSRNGVIGKDGALPWRLRSDMRFFRKTTLGHTVIMGRKTFESLGRPLPQRRNIVLTRCKGYRAEGVEVAHSPEEALRLCDGDAFVIGGEEIYRIFLPYASRIYLTEVDVEIDGDAFFPELGEEWTATELERHGADAENEYAHRILLLTRSHAMQS